MKYGTPKSARVTTAKTKPVRWLLPSLIVAVMALSGSCSKPDRPQGLLTHDQMVKALSELYIAEQKASGVGVPRDSTARIFKVMAPQVFTRIGIQDSVFKMSMDYYMEHPTELEEIYTALIDSLNLREQQLISNQLKQ